MPTNKTPQPLSVAAPAPTNQCSRCGKPNGEQWLHCQGCGHTLRDIVGEKLAYERATAAAPVAVPAGPRQKLSERVLGEVRDACDVAQGEAPAPLPPPQEPTLFKAQCTCGHLRSAHAFEQPYECMVGDEAQHCCCEEFVHRPAALAGETRTEAKAQLSYAERHHGEALLIERGKLIDKYAEEHSQIRKLYCEMFPEDTQAPMTSLGIVRAAASRIAQLERERLELLKRAERESQLAVLLANELVKHDSGEFHSSLILNPETNEWSRK